MKTAVITLVLTAVFFGIGIVALKMLAPPTEGTTTDEIAANATADSLGTAACAPDSATVAPLAADVEAMQERLAIAEAQADSLRRVMSEHQETATLAQTDAAELAATLTRMEDDALKGIVQRLDGRSFVKLYTAASSRNQGRLLGALTPAQAASFVRTQLPGGRAAPVQAASERTASGGGVAADSTDDA